MAEADKDWIMIRMVDGCPLLPAHPGSPGQRAVKRLLLLLCCNIKRALVRHRPIIGWPIIST